MREEYDNRNLQEALVIADALIDEHSNCQLGNIARADDFFNMALIYDELDQLEAAAELYKESATCICECELRQLKMNNVYIDLDEDDWLALALRISNLAVVFARMGRYDAANHHFMLANTIYVRFRHPRAVDIVYNMGNLAVITDNVNEALTWHKSALEMRVNRGEFPEDILHSLHSIAIIYEEKGDYEKAITYAETALEHATDVDYTSARIYLAELYEAIYKQESALELYEEVLGEMTQTGYRRCDYLTILSRRANLAYKTGNPSDALKLYNDVLEIYHSLTSLDIDDLNSLFYADCLRSMAEIMHDMGETANAEDYMLKSIIARKAVGKQLADDISFLIHMYLEDDTYDKAMDMLVYALAHDNKGNTDETVAAILEVFAGLENLDKLLEALEEINCEEKVVPILNMWHSNGFL